MFPSVLRNSDKRETWIELLRRENVDRSAWEPCNSDRVCSEHFVDGELTVANPNPTLKLSYELIVSQPRRELFKHPVIKRKKHNSADKPITTSATSCSFSKAELTSPLPLGTYPDLSSPVSSDHSYCAAGETLKCNTCTYKDSLIASYNNALQRLTKENQKLKREKLLRTNSNVPFSWTKIGSDRKMNFYTGLSSIKLFEAICQLLQPYLRQLSYWRGAKRVISSKVQRTFKKSPQKKLTPRDECLLVLMRLRLGLLNEDLADRFCISTTICSNIFKTWIQFLSETVGKLVASIPKEAVMANMPKVFKKAGHGKLRVIIDCSEVFIERPKALDSQAATWSDYKSHNTIKFLIGISPTGFISFLSDCYGGRASDKFICSDSGFYDCLDLYDEIMADRGFQIKEELMMKFCTLSVPPGARVKSQMTNSECKTTKDVANLRIHIERAINRIKTYRILKSIVPITMLHSCDDIVRTCAGLCNLKSLLFKCSTDI